MLRGHRAETCPRSGNHRAPGERRPSAAAWWHGADYRRVAPNDCYLTLPFWRFLVQRGSTESVVQRSTLRQQQQHPLPRCLWQGAAGPACWAMRAPGTGPLPRLSAACGRTWRIDPPSWPNPAFYKGFSAWRGRKGALCLQAPPSPLSDPDFLIWGGCSLPGAEG